MKGSQRGGARALASHLLNAHENETIELHELRGFIAEDLHSAFLETEIIATYTNCQQPFFHVSISQPQNVTFTPEQYHHAIALIEEQYPALKGQPRALIFYVRKGRHHAHVVWSRIDAETMTAAPLPFFKLKLRGVAKALAKTYGLVLPKGLENSADRNPLNYDYALAQQAKRLQANPKELKAAIHTAYEDSPTVQAFTQALAVQGLYLAQGDRRGFVAVHGSSGEILSLSRIPGIKAKDLKAKYGDPETLPTIAAVKERLAALRKTYTQTEKETDRRKKKRQKTRYKQRLAATRTQAVPRRTRYMPSALTYEVTGRRRRPQKKQLQRRKVSAAMPDLPANDSHALLSADPPQPTYEVPAPVSPVKALLSFDLR